MTQDQLRKEMISYLSNWNIYIYIYTRPYYILEIIYLLCDYKRLKKTTKIYELS